MKDLNKNGVPLLGDVPAPRLCSAEELAELGTRDGAVIVDTRADRKSFMAGHIPGSLYAPLDINFAMIVGSYVDPSTEIYLIVDEAEVEEATRTLVRIGYDHAVGYAPVSGLAEAGVADAVIARIDFSEFYATEDSDAYTLLDVRGAAEFAGAHLPGAINIAHTRLAQRIGEVPSDKPVLAHCRTGNRASSAASLLAQAGYEVTFVDGMIAEWAGWTQGAEPTEVR
jgi:hydroxyacylglutathione hydrolase